MVTSPLRWSVLIAALILLSGCDASSSVSDEEDTAALDDSLVTILTKRGQRSLSNFMLPDDGDLGGIPQDPKNPLTPEKVALGRLLFFETGLGTDPRLEAGRGTYGCATCHHPDAGFQAGKQQAIGEGGSGWGIRGERRQPAPGYPPQDVDVQPVRTPSSLNAAYQQTMHWDGSLGAHGKNEGTEARWLEGTPQAVNLLGYQGLETQAIAALTVHRMKNLDQSPVVTNETYQALWLDAFPGGEPVSLETVGLAIAAYERTLLSSGAPFQKWLRGQTGAMTEAQKRGALLFFGKSDCEQCHTGPALNSVNFYALGMSDLSGPGVLGPVPPTAGRGGFLGDDAELFKFKIPQLYNLADSPFLGHGGTLVGLRAVVEYYNDGRPDIPLDPERLAEPFVALELTEDEMSDMTDFLATALRDPNLGRFAPDALPSGNCFPANDAQARVDLGC